MWKEGFRQLRLQRPGLVAASWGQLSLMSLKRVEHRGRGVLVGLLGCRSSFCARILKSGNRDLREATRQVLAGGFIDIWGGG